jgi:hypothetical protein
MLDEALGANWRDEYVVWDCACGTANLTRDFRFKELYMSTLDKGDIDTIKDMGYNKGSQAFQYDFLNDDEVDVLGSKIPAGLKKAFAEGKKVLFLINPPYGTAKSGGSQEGNSKAGIAKTKVGDAMRGSTGGASQQLYAQFLYRIMKLKEKNSNVTIGLFSSPLFICGGSYDKFRQQFYGNFKFANGMIFQASNFADVSGAWGIAFSVWQNGKQHDGSLLMSIKSLDTDTFSIATSSRKTLYAATCDRASLWVRVGTKSLKTSDVPQLSSATKLTTCKSLRGNMVQDSMGYMNNAGNNVYQNATMVGLYSSAYGNGNGLSVLPSNFRRCVALFTARKSIKGDWINDKDEYLVPHAAAPASPLNARYEQWVNDALVYALFNTSSQQSSLRDVQYKGKTWQIKNHFFFMSAKEMKDLADKSSFQEMYADAKAYGDDSFVFKQLASLNLSDDAKAVLEAARGLVKASIAARKSWHADHPESHLQAWDAGWAQMKPMFKACHKGLYEQFTTTYKAFERRMTKGVYEFGFLR